MSHLTACLLALTALASPVRAQVKAEADLGPAVVGKDFNSSAAIIKGRAARLHLAMACGNELDFARDFALESQSYSDKRKKPDDFGLDQWPVTLMIGKAARLIDQSRDRPACESTLFGPIQNDWGVLLRNHAAGKDEPPEQVVNRVYRELYDATWDDKGNPSPMGGANAGACNGVARAGEGGSVKLTISDECLARQIRAVMADPGHGPWKWDGGMVVARLPGTSASKLPCWSEFKGPPFPPLEGVEGDWDQAVLEYTRLTALLYRYGGASEVIADDVNTAITVLNRRFLTLRSSPDQGAVARESYNLVASCGNLPNQFGDAIDTVNGTGADPGTDTYSDAAKEAVGKKSLWDSFKRFLAAVAVLIGIGLAAAAVGAIAAGIVGGITGVGAGIVAVVVGVGLFISAVGGSVEESENHLLMQNTARYIKNKLMMAELSTQQNRAAFDKIADLNEELRIWLLEHMQQIVREDFVEYNAKPYNRLSHASILNLLDYACDVSWDYEFSPIILNSDRGCDAKDVAVVTAAAALMDLSAAKDAVGSLEGRRLVPFRRLAEQNYLYYNGPLPPPGGPAHSILDLSSSADNQLAALQIWTGQMRHAPGGVAAPGTFGDLEWYSTSQYRPDPMILDMAVNKTIAREQQYRHHTRERYVSGDGWLITAGGTDEGPAQGLRLPWGFSIAPPISHDVINDRGVGVPTTLMTGAQILTPAGDRIGRDKMRQFLRFDGNKKDWGVAKGENGNPDKPQWSFSDNNCVAGSFACGLALNLPSDFDAGACRTREVTSNFYVVDSTKCPSFNDGDASESNDIYIAIFTGPKGWGFFEVAQQSSYGRSVDAFAAAIKAFNKDRLGSWNSAESGDTVEYFAVTQRRLLRFTPKNEDFGADRRACGVVNHESRARLTISNVPAEQAGACLSVGPRIFIDLNDKKNPIRRGEGGLTLEPFGR